MEYNGSVILTFNKKESIDVVIEKLQDLKEIYKIKEAINEDSI